MRLKTPRIAPLQDAEFTPEQKDLLGPYDTGNGILNIYRTLARKPQAAKGFLGWGRYVLRESTFDAKLRELIILRIGWLWKSGYEWTQHSRLARQHGMTDAEIERIKTGPSAPEWTAEQRLLLQAADELKTGGFVTDATWADLSGLYSEEHLMDVVYTAAHYTQVCMILNSFGIQVEGHQKMDEDLRA